MNKELITNEWYQELVEDCKAIITEAVFTSRWALVEGHWHIGERLRADENFSTKLLQDLAVNIGISERKLWYAVQLYDKFPQLDSVPEGKNISMNKLITKYLPEQKLISEPLPKGKYRVIYADPPWKYGNMQHSKDEQETTLDTHYPTMEIDELCALPIKDLSAPNSVLFLWTTSPLLEKSFEVINAWGFDYKSSMIWDKMKHNVGYYVSVRHEFLLICTKGSCLPTSKTLTNSVQHIERTKHSQKPQEFYQIIETMYEPPYIELFAREPRKGWSAWGNQLNDKGRN